MDKVRKRDHRRVFKDGERVSYVLIQAPPNAKGFEKAEVQSFHDEINVRILNTLLAKDFLLIGVIIWSIRSKIP